MFFFCPRCVCFVCWIWFSEESYIHISVCSEVSRLEVVLVVEMVVVVVQEEEEVWSTQYLCTFESLSLVDALFSSVVFFFSIASLFSCLCRKRISFKSGLAKWFLSFVINLVCVFFQQHNREKKFWKLKGTENCLFVLFYEREQKVEKENKKEMNRRPKREK